jgi:hypothetical protein
MLLPLNLELHLHRRLAANSFQVLDCQLTLRGDPFSRSAPGVPNSPMISTGILVTPSECPHKPEGLSPNYSGECEAPMSSYPCFAVSNGRQNLPLQVFAIKAFSIFSISDSGRIKGFGLIQDACFVAASFPREGRPAGFIGGDQKGAGLLSRRESLHHNAEVARP